MPKDAGPPVTSHSAGFPVPANGSAPRAPASLPCDELDVEAAVVPPVDVEDSERLAAEELARITPSNKTLLKLAEKHRPPASWFEQEEEKPW